jgi:hypothetical protein
MLGYRNSCWMMETDKSPLSRMNVDAMLPSVSEAVRQEYEREWQKQNLKLLPAYKEFLIVGPVGGHNEYLRRRSDTTLHMRLSWWTIHMLILTGLCFGLSRIPGLSPIAGFMSITLFIFLFYYIPLWLVLFAELVSIPFEIAIKNRQSKKLVLAAALYNSKQDATHTTSAAPKPVDHAQYHDRLKFSLVSCGSAYKKLCSHGIFGAHREYLGDRRGVRNCQRLTSALVWSILLAPLAYATTYVIFQAHTDALNEVALMLVPLATAIIARLVSDAWRLPQMVAARNVEIQKQLLQGDC